jgi:hypothetical protein
MLLDKPESSDIRFGHTVVSDWLADEIKKAPKRSRLALTGGLGTGKSTILKAAIDKLKAEDSSIKTAYVDVWKLDKESVRRSAILKIAKDLRPDDYKTIEAIKESAYGTRVENVKPKLFNIYWNPAGIFFALFIGLIIFGVSLAALSLIPVAPDSSKEITKYLLSFVVGALGVFFKLMDKSVVSIQRTISKAPMVGAEEFEECLQEILSSEKIKKNKTIIIFDNIDRASPSSSRAILSGISAFFDHSEKDTDIVIVVPFDPSCLKDDKSGERPLLDDCEKMFDAIIPLPKITSEDLTDFALDQLKEALKGFSYKENQLQDLAYLVSFSPYRSPREIKHMVNQLTSRLNLAKSLENNSDSRFQTGSTLLPNGAVTSHPECLLKFLICEKIYPQFTETLVSEGLDIAKSFEADPESSLIQPLDTATKDSLIGFLQATMGIPRNPPQSAAVFLYMKGPDQVLAIPSGQAISDAIYMGDGEKLKSVILPSEGTPVAHKDITSVLQYHRKKFAQNSQALKNSIRAIYSGMSDVQKIEKLLAAEICEILNLVPDILTEISPKWLKVVTGDFLEVSPVNKVWKTLDADFKKLILSEEDLKKAATISWLSDYLVSIHQQTKGKERSGIGSVKIPLQVLLDSKVHEAIGEDYPSTYANDEDALVAVKSYLTQNDKQFDDFVRNRFKNCGDAEGIEARYQELATAWTTATQAWLKDKESQKDAENLSSIVFYWPAKSAKAKPHLEAIKNWIVGQAATFNQKSSAGFAADVLDICIALYKNEIPADANINGIIHHALSVINEDGLKTIVGRYSDANTVWETLLPQANPQLPQAVDRNKFFSEALHEESPILKPLITGFSGLNSKEALLDTLLALDIISNIEVEIKELYKHCQNSLRPKVIKVFVKYGVDEATMTAMLDSFVSNPDASNDNVITEAQSLSDTLKKHATDFAITSLTANVNPWTDKETKTLAWIHLSIEDVLEATLKDFIDRVIERGSQNGANDSVKNNCTSQVLKIWEQGHGFTEKSFKILKKSAATEFGGRISSLADKHSIKDGLAGLVGNMIDKVIGETETQNK